jgi:hypothetical protein
MRRIAPIKINSLATWATGDEEVDPDVAFLGAFLR